MSPNIKAVTKSHIKHQNIVALIDTVVYSVQVDQRGKNKGSGLHWLANADMSSHHKRGTKYGVRIFFAVILIKLQLRLL